MVKNESHMMLLLSLTRIYVDNQKSQQLFLVSWVWVIPNLIDGGRNIWQIGWTIFNINLIAQRETIYYCRILQI